MGYAELVKALEAETARTAETIVQAARRDGERLIAEAEREAQAILAEAGDRQARAREAEHERRDAEARREAQRRELLAMRQLLDELFADAAAQLGGDLAPLLAELAPELAGQTGTLEVTAEEVARVQPPPGFRVVAGAPGVLARLDAGLVLDDTWPGRLARARPSLEPELARLLFGDAHAGD